MRGFWPWSYLHKSWVLGCWVLCHFGTFKNVFLFSVVTVSSFSSSSSSLHLSIFLDFAALCPKTFLKLPALYFLWPQNLLCLLGSMSLRLSKAYFSVRDWHKGVDGSPQYSLCCCSVAQSGLTLCNSMKCSTPGQGSVSFTISNSCPLSWWSIQPSHSLSPPSPPALNLSQHQGLFQWVGS